MRLEAIPNPNENDSHLQMRMIIIYKLYNNYTNRRTRSTPKKISFAPNLLILKDFNVD